MNRHEVPGHIVKFRRFSEWASAPLLPGRVIDEAGVMQRVEDEARNGRGTLVVFTHFGYRDGAQVNKDIIFANPVLSKRPIVNPISYHQYKIGFDKAAQMIYGARFYPVVNEDTIQKPKFEHLSKRQGLPEFLDAAAQAFTYGGVVTIAVNAGRREFLDMDDPQPTIGLFVAGMKKKGIENFGVLLVSLGIPGKTSYSKKEAGGLNVRQTYELTTAGYFTLEELLSHPQVNRNIRTIDPFVRRELAKVAPKAYLQHSI